MPIPHRQRRRTFARMLLTFGGALWFALLAIIDSLAAWVPDPVARRCIGGDTALKFYYC